MRTETSSHQEDIRVEEILDSDGRGPIISQGDDWGDDELDADLLCLEDVWVLVGVVPRVHDGGSELGACLREEDLESQVGCIHLDRQFPGFNSNFSNFSSGNGTLTSFVEKWPQHITKSSGVTVKLVSAETMVLFGVNDALDSMALLVDQNLAFLVG